MKKLVIFCTLILCANIITCSGKYDVLSLKKPFEQLNYNDKIERALIDCEILLGYNQLHFAVVYCSDKAVLELLALGLDVNAQDFVGDTPLHESARKNARQKTQYLLAAGANLDSQNKNNNTPLDLAVIFRADKVLDQLLNAGASVLPKYRNYKCTSSLHYAYSSEMKQLLLHGPEGQAAKKIKYAYCRYKENKIDR